MYLKLISKLVTVKLFYKFCCMCNIYCGVFYHKINPEHMAAKLFISQVCMRNIHVLLMDKSLSTNSNTVEQSLFLIHYI